MKRLVFILIFIFLQKISADTHTSASASYADCSTSCAISSMGDTVVIPEDTSTWPRVLNLTHGIIFKGAGRTKTMIESAQSYFIKYEPDAASRSSDARFEIREIRFSGSGAIYIFNLNTLPVSNFVLGECYLNNTRINIEGNIYGVIYNDTLKYTTGSTSIFMQVLGYHRDSWDNHPASFSFSYSRSPNLYFEDNYITGTDALNINSGHGGRYVIRYNVFDMTNSNVDGCTFDMHGCQEGGIYSLQICEIYGNILSGFINGKYFVYQRGGKLICFNNRGSGTGTNDLRMNNDFDCQAIGDSTNDPTNYPQYPNDVYYFNNLWNTTNLNYIYDFSDAVSPPQTAENVTFWLDKRNSFNGTSGIGSGPTTPTMDCTKGVAYWVTDFDPDTLPPTTISDMRIYCQSGKLYKASATNTWALYYTPYNYPHPLRIQESRECRITIVR